MNVAIYILAMNTKKIIHSELQTNLQVFVILTNFVIIFFSFFVFIPVEFFFTNICKCIFISVSFEYRRIEEICR